jgi:hypothetical protein
MKQFNGKPIYEIDTDFIIYRDEAGTGLKKETIPLEAISFEDYIDNGMTRFFVHFGIMY